MGIIIGVVVAIVIVVILLRGNATKCPKCGKAFAMQEIDRKTVSSFATTMDVEHDIRNKKGEKTGSYTQTVPATTYVHDCIDQCKYCGFQRQVRRDTTYKS